MRIRLNVAREHMADGTLVPAGTCLGEFDLPEGITRKGFFELLRIAPLGTDVLDDEPAPRRAATMPADSGRRARAGAVDA